MVSRFSACDRSYGVAKAMKRNGDCGFLFMRDKPGSKVGMESRVEDDYDVADLMISLLSSAPSLLWL